MELFLLVEFYHPLDYVCNLGLRLPSGGMRVEQSMISQIGLKKEIIIINSP